MAQLTSRHPLVGVLTSKSGKNVPIRPHPIWLHPSDGLYFWSHTATGSNPLEEGLRHQIVELQLGAGAAVRDRVAVGMWTTLDRKVGPKMSQTCYQVDTPSRGFQRRVPEGFEGEDRRIELSV